MKGMNLHNEEAEQTPRINTENHTETHRIKFLKAKAVREAACHVVMYKGSSIRLTAGFVAETIVAKRK